jgi:tagatose 6-phosphate kinase
LVIKPNRKELAATFNRPVDTDAALHDAMRCAIDAGAHWIVVTLGAQGACLCNGQRFWHIPAPAIQVVNAIGSGDAFAAGLAAALFDRQPLPEAGVPEACLLAAACAAANALTDTTGFVRPQDVADLQRRIRLIPLN